MDYGLTSATSSATINPDRRWWNLSEGEAAKSVSGVIAQLQPQQSTRLSQQVISARLYGNLAPFGPLGFASLVRATSQLWPRERISFNVVGSAIDAIVAKVAAKSKPQPYYLTD